MTTTKTKARSKAAKPAPKRALKKPEALSVETVDPRLAARRRDVKRTEGRRRLRTLLALSLITASAVGALAFLQSSWMDVNEVVVDGHAKTDPSQVVASSRIELGDALVDLDADMARAGVLTLPWVASADISRSWNGTITITVTEREPTIALPVDRAAGGETSRFVLVDRTGRQLGLVDSLPYGFMPIAGLVASAEPGQPAPSEVHGVIRLLDLLTPERLQDIDQIVVDERSIYLELAEQGRVRLGNDSGLAEKLVSLDTILSSVDLRCLWEIDVRVHTAPAVTRLRVDGVPGAPLTDLSTCT